jgi:hypothetical protein
LAADIAGYSRLMGADEEGTLAALKAIGRDIGIRRAGRIEFRFAIDSDIATVLAISLNTVATHVRNILAKTGCANRTEAAAYAMSKGLAP